MFVVEIGAVITSVDLVAGLTHHAPDLDSICKLHCGYGSTVLFANFAEAMAEGRGKAQAETLRKAPFGNHGPAIDGMREGRADPGIATPYRRYRVSCCGRNDCWRR